MLHPMKITFLIPAYNESATIGDVLDRIGELGLDYEAIVVDDGSTDTTAEVVESRASNGAVRLLRKPNGGKGSALRHGIPHCRGEIVVIQDADMEYDPRDVPALIEPIARDVADVVFGSRLSGGRPQRAYMFWHMIGNRFLSLLTGLLFNTTITDMETGYKAFRTDILRQLHLTENHFGIEPEITGEICRRRCGSTRRRSATTGGPTTRARTSPGRMGFGPFSCFCGHAFGRCDDCVWLPGGMFPV